MILTYLKLFDLLKVNVKEKGLIMKTSDIKRILNDFTQKSRYKSILIDGPWGCGKTYEINQFIKSIQKQNKKIKLHYISLFGLASIDEVNTALYQTIHPIKKRIKNGVQLVSRAISVIPQIPNISEALDFQLNQGNQNNIKGKHLIIFDDLDRVADTLKFSDLFGYLNSLYLSNCRFICLVSTSELKERMDEFQKFKEKIFDCTYVINEDNLDVFDSIFQKLNIDYVGNAFPLFKNNLRLANKVKLFYLDVKKYLDDNIDKLNFLFSDFQLLQACIYTILICLGYHKDYKVEEERKDKYTLDVKQFGEMIAKELSYYRDYDEGSKDIFLNIEMRTLIYNLINVYLYMDYEKFSIAYSKIENKPEYILNKSFLYLSDSNKVKYIDEFVKFCKTDKFVWNEKTQDMIISIVSYSNFEFDNETLTALASKIPLDNSDFLRFDLKVRLETACEEDKKIKCNEFINSLINLSNSKIKEETVKEFKSLIVEPVNYVKLSNYLNDLKQKDEHLRKQICELLENNNYYFPDIRNDIDNDIWHYAHTLSEFIYLNGDVIKYKDFLDNEIKCNVSNESYVDRIKALKKYRLHLIEEKNS